MGNIKFTKDRQVRKWNNPYNWEQGCHKCKKPFGEDEVFTRVDVENDEFRGNDDVYCFHRTCNWNTADLK